MKNLYLAKRYARALFELAQDKECLEKILADFTAFNDLLQQNPALGEFLKLPGNHRNREQLAAVLKTQFSPWFVNFIRLIMKNVRYPLLSQIYVCFQENYDACSNRRRLKVTTAIPLTAEKLTELRQEISTSLKSETIIENQVDASILGGCIIQLNGREYNASLAEGLRKLKFKLTQN